MFLRAPFLALCPNMRGPTRGPRRPMSQVVSSSTRPGTACDSAYNKQDTITVISKKSNTAQSRKLQMTNLPNQPTTDPFQNQTANHQNTHTHDQHDQGHSNFDGNRNENKQNSEAAKPEIKKSSTSFIRRVAGARSSFFDWKIQNFEKVYHIYKWFFFVSVRNPPPPKSK